MFAPELAIQFTCKRFDGARTQLVHIACSGIHDCNERHEETMEKKEQCKRKIYCVTLNKLQLDPVEFGNKRYNSFKFNNIKFVRNQITQLNIRAIVFWQAQNSMQIHKRMCWFFSRENCAKNFWLQFRESLKICFASLILFRISRLQVWISWTKGKPNAKDENIKMINLLLKTQHAYNVGFCKSI